MAIKKARDHVNQKENRKTQRTSDMARPVLATCEQNCVGRIVTVKTPNKVQQNAKASSTISGENRAMQPNRPRQ